MESTSIPLLERRLVGRLVRTAFLRDRRGGPWVPPAHLKHEPVLFEGNTGAALAGLWFPAARSRGVVVLAHPDKRYGKHWFVKAGWVEFLHNEDFDVLTFDFAGYGESHGPATYYHEDVVAAVRLAEKWAGGLPVHVVGVSMGAFAAANASPYLANVSGLVLESPYPSFNAWYARGPSLWAMEAFDRLFPRSSAAIQADVNIARAAPQRVLIALGEDDEVTPPRLTEAVIAHAPPERTEVLRVPAAKHLALLDSPAYRQAVLRTLGAEPEAALAIAQSPSG